jgi:hypothetical protein
MNLYIVGAIVVQGLISKVDALAGAIVGYLVTTGILIWGWILYSQGDAVAFFGIVFSLPVFVIACLVWYGFDTFELVGALNGGELDEGPTSLDANRDTDATNPINISAESVSPQIPASQPSASNVGVPRISPVQPQSHVPIVENRTLDSRLVVVNVARD